MTLTEIANKHKTDKGTEWFEKHSYTETYCNYIPSDKPCRLMEIGIWHGDSVRMWKEYNPQMHFFGLDYEDCSAFFDVNLCDRIFRLDQRDKAGQQIAAAEIGSLDFVVDDGAHQMHHQHTSLISFLPIINSGGIYFIEDLHTCPNHAANERTDFLLQNWLTTNFFASPYLSYEENKYISENIKDVEFFNNGKLVKMVKV